MGEEKTKNNSSKNLIIIGVVGLIIAAVLLFRSNYLSISQLITPGDQVTVELTEDGYKPENLTIKKGTTVTFISKRDQHHWPASNLHPIHDIYPEFDPREPVPADKSWSFRFDKVGSWKYHDHLAPYYTGVVEVRE